MFSKDIFAGRVVALRKERSISQASLADVVGVGRTTVTMLEKGGNLPSVEVLDAIADYFNVSLDYLAGRTDNPEINE